MSCGSNAVLASVDLYPRVHLGVVPLSRANGVLFALGAFNALNVKSLKVAFKTFLNDNDSNWFS